MPFSAKSSSPAAGQINFICLAAAAGMNWAVGREYIDRTPFRRGTRTLVRKRREDNQRRRRVSEDEDARLLAAAPPLLRSMIIAALDTGMRQGEMLALRFADTASSATTTERYDNQKLENLQAAAARLERGDTFDPTPRDSGSPSICQLRTCTVGRGILRAPCTRAPDRCPD